MTDAVKDITGATAQLMQAFIKHGLEKPTRIVVSRRALTTIRTADKDSGARVNILGVEFTAE